MTSAVLIISAPYKAAANAVGEAMGWGPDNYTVPLSSDGISVTHYACRTDITQSFLDLLANPPSIEGVATVLAMLKVYTSDDLWGVDHMNSVLQENSYIRMELS